MDPIHPIVPVTPHILPILPTPMVGHIDRDAQRDPADGSGPERRRRRGGGGGADTGPGDESGSEPRLADPMPRRELPAADEDDGLGHVDLTA